jgi:hypothetical protein
VNFASTETNHPNAAHWMSPRPSRYEASRLETPGSATNGMDPFMNRSRSSLAMLALLVLSHSTWAAESDEPSPEKALEAYVEGLRVGSLAKLEELFLADGQFCSMTAKATSQISCRKFSEVLGTWVARPDTRASGRVTHRHDATPSMSAVTYELDFGGTSYIDQLLLYRIEGRWRVVAKTTAAQ